MGKYPNNNMSVCQRAKSPSWFLPFSWKRKFCAKIHYFLTFYSNPKTIDSNIMASVGFVWSRFLLSLRYCAWKQRRVNLCRTLHINHSIYGWFQRFIPSNRWQKHIWAHVRGGTADRTELGAVAGLHQPSCPAPSSLQPPWLCKCSRWSLHTRITIRMNWEKCPPSFSEECRTNLMWNVVFLTCCIEVKL